MTKKRKGATLTITLTVILPLPLSLTLTLLQLLFAPLVLFASFQFLVASLPVANQQRQSTGVNIPDWLATDSTVVIGWLMLVVRYWVCRWQHESSTRSVGCVLRRIQRLRGVRASQRQTTWPHSGPHVTWPRPVLLLTTAQSIISHYIHMQITMYNRN